MPEAREASSSSPLPLSTGMVEKPKVKIGLGLAKIKGKKRRRRKKNSIAATRLPGAAFLVLGEKSNAKKFNVEGDDDDDDDDDDGEGGRVSSRSIKYGRVEWRCIFANHCCDSDSIPANGDEVMLRLRLQPDADSTSQKRRRGRWDVKGINEQEPTLLSPTSGVSSAAGTDADAVTTMSSNTNTTSDEGIDDALGAASRPVTIPQRGIGSTTLLTSPTLFQRSNSNSNSNSNSSLRATTLQDPW